MEKYLLFGHNRSHRMNADQTELLRQLKANYYQKILEFVRHFALWKKDLLLYTDTRIAYLVKEWANTPHNAWASH